MDLSKYKGIPDTIHLEDLTEKEIIEEHYYLTDQEQIYSDMFHLKYPEIYDQDIQPILEVEDARDFYEQYYLPAIVDVTSKDESKLSIEELSLLNDTDKLQRQVISLAEELEKKTNMVNSLGIQERYEQGLDILDATVQGKVIKELSKFMDS